MTYTKGKWDWQLFGDTYYLTAQHGMREIIIGAINHPEFSIPVPAMNYNGKLQVVDKNHPNAKLISKAPEMHEALKGVFISTKQGVGISKRKLDKIESLINEIESCQ